MNYNSARFTEEGEVFGFYRPIGTHLYYYWDKFGTEVGRKMKVSFVNAKNAITWELNVSTGDNKIAQELQGPAIKKEKESNGWNW